VLTASSLLLFPVLSSASAEFTADIISSMKDDNVSSVAAAD